MLILLLLFTVTSSIRCDVSNFCVAELEMTISDRKQQHKQPLSMFMCVCYLQSAYVCILWSCRKEDPGSSEH